MILKSLESQDYHKLLVNEQFSAGAAAYASCAVQASDFSISTLVEMIKPEPNWLSMDIATGAGHMGMALAGHVRFVDAVDLTKEMLVVAKELADARNIKNIAFEIGDCSEIARSSEVYDLVTCRLGIHHFPDVAKFMNEARRILKFGGVLGIVDSHLPQNDALDEINRIQKIHDPSHVACLTKDQFKRELSAAGFEITGLKEGLVRIGFKSWVERKPLKEKHINLLRQLMRNPAHEDTAELLNVRTDPGEEFTFTFQRILISAQKNVV